MQVFPKRRRIEPVKRRSRQELIKAVERGLNLFARKSSQKSSTRAQKLTIMTLGLPIPGERDNLDLQKPIYPKTMR